MKTTMYELSMTWPSVLRGAKIASLIGVAIITGRSEKRATRERRMVIKTVVVEMES